MKRRRRFDKLSVFAVLALLSLSSVALAIPVNLSDGNPATTDAWATACQTPLDVSTSVDGSFGTGANGWAIYIGSTTSQTAVYKAITDISNPVNTLLTFDLHSLHSNAGHNIGRFRLSVTNDDRSLYGQGVECGNPSPEGTATWTVLNPVSAVSLNGQTLTIQGDNSILASGTNPSSDVVTIVAQTSLSGITGFRLEVLEDASLPTSGPGRFTNGNFVLTEFVIDQEPFGSATVPTMTEWGMIIFMLFAGLGAIYYLRKRRIES